MKSISNALRALLRSRSTTLCYCWKLTRLDGEVFGFTTASRDIEYLGVNYSARTGFTKTNFESSSDLAVDNSEANGVIDSAVITEADILVGRWDYADVEIFLLNWADTSMGSLSLPGGRIGEVRKGRHRFHAELAGLAANMQQAIGRLYGPGCAWDLGSTECGINLALHTTDAVVTSVTDRKTFVASGLVQATDWFTYGLLTFQSGCENTGLAMEVKSFTSGGAIVLVEPMPFTISIGDSFAVNKGCGKRFLEDCVAVWANGQRFGGYPWLPGMDRLSRGVQ